MKKALFVLFVVAVSLWAAFTLTSNREAAGGGAMTRDGSTVEVEAVPGASITIVHFWGTWCGPCRHELPTFVEFKKRYESRGVGFHVVADDPDFETVDRYLEAADLELDFLLDSQGSTGRAWDVRIYPTTFVIGPSNEILARYKGTVDWSSSLQRREILRLGGIDP